jgi:hypothetical protein
MGHLLGLPGELFVAATDSFTNSPDLAEGLDLDEANRGRRRR